MKNLLTLQFSRLKKQKSLYICLGIMVALLFISALSLFAIQKLTAVLVNEMEEVGEVSISDLFPETNSISFLLGASDNSSIVMILGIFIVLFVCEDYDQNIVKNIYSRGYSRQSVYLSKMITVFSAATAVFIIVEIAAFLIGLLFFGVGGASVLKLLGIVVIQYLAVMANTAFAFAITSVLRRNGSSIAVIIVTPIFMSLVLSILDTVLKLEKYTLSSMWFSNLTAEVSAMSVSAERMIICLVASVLYIALFVFGGLWLNKKNEL